ncbi:MAG: DUF4406 domain-containing protein [Candidatus Cloacimonetes bacterium]|nr:DUF4406 domain-containing protein [Candidatus Cloacimonadota bacterium]
MKKPLIIYICGPITGMPNGNAKLFEDAEDWYINQGHMVINPHNIGNHLGNVSETEIVKNELASITTIVDVIALLPGWQNSRYGLVEVATGIASAIPFVKAFSFNPLHPILKLMAYGSYSYKELACEHGKAAQAANKLQSRKKEPFTVRQDS